ncbi:uncharacterized protein EV420DRAFT_1481953 [Desarmillaria tabescens]|uniref:Uncharacterized protein n=1 Tax=Armillaria tabescens TaxID=1929756 RepID=A0AA39K1P3_ARMTA|nr:uncharacterized protein EV420DRAFT_1481953 [Desarmillaria tabescens]KAK0452961.1 hypothetical protein EV420DRAFT_1481953 [Desarmillaria tabescens]
MQLKLSALASVAALVASVHAATVGTYYCTQASFQGACAYTSAESGTCVTFATGSFWNNVVTSMRPDIGVVCTLYNGLNCTATTFEVKSQNNNITWANKKASSYLCT